MENTVILGDSYSTFEGYIPSGYACYYTKEGRPEIGVNDVELTWWKRYLNETGDNLVLNESYSGTTICNTGYNGSDWKDISFIGRFDALVEKGFFEKNKIDKLFILGGTNDSWANSPLGELSFENIEKQDKYQVLPAVVYLMKRVKECLRNVKVYVVINCDIKQEIIDGIALAAEHYGIPYTKLHGIDKVGGHPTPKGMEQICQQVIKLTEGAKA